VTLASVLHRQLRPLLVAGGLMVAGLWISIPLGHAEAGVLFAVGILLGFLNHVLTEMGLARSLAQDGEVTRKQFALGSAGRLAIITLLAFVAVALFWPYGLAALFGLALMHLVIVVFVGLPLLQEMRKA
jgi:hypothetical protein